VNPSRPTLAQLRSRAQKGRHREVGNWLARRVGRPSAIPVTWLAVRLGLSAHQVTLAALAASLAGPLAIASGTRPGFIGGVALLYVAFWLDHVDGQVARWRGTSSLDGVYLDYLMHHAAALALGYALGHGLAARSGDPAWCAAGFATASGWLFLGLQNDCRYKAFFQRLKSGSGSYRVDAGSGGRPAPPAPWPRRGRAALTWPAYKACEPHAVLLGLSALAIIAALSPAAWAVIWRGSTRLMALIAPSLAFGRCFRAVSRGATADEFGRWFRAEARDPSDAARRSA